MDISLQFLALVPVVLGVVQVGKIAGLSSRWAPVLSLVLGVGAVSLLDSWTAANVVQGVIVGLSASGLWSGVKSTVA